MKNLGPVQHILGMQVCREDSRIILDQKSYIKKVLERFNMTECKPSPTPMEVGLKLNKSDQKNTKLDYRHV